MISNGVKGLGEVYGGEGGIRTPDSLTTMPDFESDLYPITSFIMCHLQDTEVPVLTVESVEGPRFG